MHLFYLGSAHVSFVSLDVFLLSKGSELLALVPFMVMAGEKSIGGKCDAS
jgi:hypothetical protein